MRNLKGGVQLFATLLFAIFGAALARRRFSNYEVAGASMLPTYNPGDWLFVDHRASPRPGDVVIAQDPRDPARTIVKRLHHITDDGRLYLVGDNPQNSTDSRTYGAVPPELIRGRVLLRYHRAKKR